jgi:hypothetical protein
VISRGLRPDANEISFRIAERRHPQGALGTGRRRSDPAVFLDALQRQIYVRDVDEREDSAFTERRLTSDKVSDDMAGGIRKGRLIAIPPGHPAEHLLIEVSRPRRRATRDMQVGDTPDPEHVRRVSSGHRAIIRSPAPPARITSRGSILGESELGELLDAGASRGDGEEALGVTEKRFGDPGGGDEIGALEPTPGGRQVAPILE